MAIVVTGGAGFIGATLVEALNRRGHVDIVLVEAWDHEESWHTLQGLSFTDIIDLKTFRDALAAGAPGGSTGLEWDNVEAIFHLGACTDTLETRIGHLLSVNTGFSKEILAWSAALRVPLIYASSASVYGASQHPSHPDQRAERPLNAYAFSKLLFDQHVRREIETHPAPVYGFRFFNVYGIREAHKGRMASMAYQLGVQAEQGGPMRLFAGFDGYEDGGHLRDFVSVDDVVEVLLKAMESRDERGLYDLGTGTAVSFLDTAHAWQRHHDVKVAFFPCPDHIQKAYQSYTCADIAPLRAAGLAVDFQPIDGGIHQLAELFAERSAREAG